MGLGWVGVMVWGCGEGGGLGGGVCGWWWVGVRVGVGGGGEHISAAAMTLEMGVEKLWCYAG